MNRTSFMLGYRPPKIGHSKRKPELGDKVRLLPGLDCDGYIGTITKDNGSHWRVEWDISTLPIGWDYGNLTYERKEHLILA